MKTGCWTDERVERLAAMWSDATAADIAAALNELPGPALVTRNAAIGKARRLGLPPKVEYASPGRPLKQCRPRGYEWRERMRAVAVEPEIPAVLAAPADPLWLTILDVGADQCRYPVDGTDNPILFCGHPAAPKSPYCWEHHAKVYVS
jgi:hypothetical protein